MQYQSGMTFLPDEPIIIMQPVKMNITDVTPEQRHQMEMAVRTRIKETPGTDYYILDLTNTTANFSEVVGCIRSLGHRS